MAVLALLLLLPVLAACLAPLCKKRGASLALAGAIGLANLGLSALVFAKGLSCRLGIELHGFVFAFDSASSSLFLLAAALVFLLAAVYGALQEKEKGDGLYPPYLYLSLSAVNGALLADHLGLLLLFWEGLLCTLFGMLLYKHYENPRALLRGFALAATADLILMLGVTALTHAAHTGILREISGLSATGLGSWGAVCLLVGALGKAGSFPFHSWLPDGAEDGGAAFAAAFPGGLYGLLGGYLAARIGLAAYVIPSGSPISLLLITLGMLSLLGGIALALRQKALRRAVAYIAIAQAGLIGLALGAGLCGFRGAALLVCTGGLAVSGLQMLLPALANKKGDKLPPSALCGVIALCAALLLCALQKPLLAAAGLPSEGFSLLPFLSLLLCAALGRAALHPQNRPALAGLTPLESGGGLDPYAWLMGVLGLFSRGARKIEDGVSWVYDVAVPSAVAYIGERLSRFDNGSLSRYLTLALAGLLLVGLVFAITLV